VLTLGGMTDPGALLNVVDVEATCWNGTPPPGMPGEISHEKQHEMTAPAMPAEPGTEKAD